MKNEITINFNNEKYLATYNKQTGYYEIDLTAPEVGGIYNANINFTDLLNNSSEETQVIQVFAKEKIKIETNKVFIWIFDYKDFSVKDIVEIADYEINIDEETNANTIIKVLKKTTAKARDIIAIKKNNEVVYWGVIDNIQNEDGKKLYEYTIKYITNMFREKVCVSKNIENTEVEEGTYIIKSALDINKVLDVAGGSEVSGANVQLYENNGTDAQKWKITKDEDGVYTIKNVKSEKVLDVTNGIFQSGTNVQQCNANESSAQKWRIIKDEGATYKIKIKGYELYLHSDAQEVNNGTNIKIYDARTDDRQKFILEKIEEQTIKDEGIEDFLAKAIEDYFINNTDEFINKKYLEVRVKTHTKLQTKVTNVEDGLYYLNTWMTNCTQLYNINYNFFVEDKKLIIEIENKEKQKELIDVKAHAISNYTEIFETDIVSKVEVVTDTVTYFLYLLNDRTTTTNMTDGNRADGRTERVYTKNYEEAPQKALDIIKSNSYNHNITFNLCNRFIKPGTPIAIKTKESLIHDTYISAIKITPKKFTEYTCGNIRIKFIDKLLKERNK